MQAKYQLLNRGGTLSFEVDTARFAEVGGLKNLRRWILQRKSAFDGSAPELDAPTGVAVNFTGSASGVILPPTRLAHHAL